MAVSEMKKLCCFVPRSDTGRLVSALQRMSCVEVTQTKTDGDAALSAADTTAEAAALTADIAEARRAIEFLMPYDNRKYSLFDAPPEASIDDFDSGLDTIVMGEVRDAAVLRDRIASLQSSLAEANAAADALTAWDGWETELPYDKTAHTVTVGGTLPPNADINTVWDRLSSFACIMQTVRDNKKGPKTVSVSAHRDDYDEVKKILASSGFTCCSVSATKEGGYAEGELRRLKSKKEKLEKELEEAKKSAVRLAERLPDIKSLHDILLTRQKRMAAMQSVGETKCVSVITGWVPARAVGKVEKLLCAKGAAYSFDEPEEGDDVPVVLSNSAGVENFEPIVSMYALPLYGAFDPTMLVSVFYTVIFGLMFADVGYGLILLLGCLAGLRFLHPKEGMKRMMKMFAICGVACIISGVLFGGYFGDLPSALMEGFGGKTDTKSPAVLFDMVDEPIMFLVVSVVIGVVHMVAGMIVKFCVLCKRGHVFDAVADVGSWLIVFAGIGLIFINSTAGLVCVILGVAMLICTQGRHEKKVIMKIGKGIMSLYDIVSYASDLLSYTRILALGLASAVIASVVNLLATMGGVSVGGIIMFILIFPLGHAINFLVNILGTYVHTSRLQYIEFFNKFYESGGREFSPLSPQSKYVNLK